ncbi:hypothetical protein MMC07_008065 [Pseudocyphellaria aurata]|nr:hypothetical protein [Pseudocyphellaria aurata]
MAAESLRNILARLSLSSSSNSSTQKNTTTTANTNPFSALPAEIHVRIAEQCGFNDRYNLCRTSKSLKERCWHVLYRDIDLERDRRVPEPGSYTREPQWIETFTRAIWLLDSLDRHPEYGQHVRVFKGSLLRSQFHSDVQRAWRTWALLTHVQRVEIGSRKFDESFLLMDPSWQPPCHLFQSATSVTLVGHVEYKLAVSILRAIDPGKLQHLCLDGVREPNIEQNQYEIVPGGCKPGDIAEEGRMIAYGATAGLLTTLTGRCTSIRTLMLRRRGQIQDGPGWDAGAEEASYVEWASFLASVQSTMEKFTFEQAARWSRLETMNNADGSSRIMDDRFRRLVLPTICAGNWPCLNAIALHGVRSPYGEAQLTMELRAVLGGDTTIVIEERPVYVEEDGIITENYQS